MRKIKRSNQEFPEDRMRAWHAMLSLVRDEADASGHAFLAYLVGLGVEHTRIMLGGERPSKML